MGIEADKIDEIIDAHTEVTTSLKQERDSYKADAEKYQANEYVGTPPIFPLPCISQLL